MKEFAPRHAFHHKPLLDFFRAVGKATFFPQRLLTAVAAGYQGSKKPQFSPVSDLESLFNLLRCEAFQRQHGAEIHACRSKLAVHLC